MHGPASLDRRRRNGSIRRSPAADEQGIRIGAHQPRAGRPCSDRTRPRTCQVDFGTNQPEGRTRASEDINPDSSYHELPSAQYGAGYHAWRPYRVIIIIIIIIYTRRKANNHNESYVMYNIMSTCMFVYVCLCVCACVRACCQHAHVGTVKKKFCQQGMNGLIA